MKLFLTLAFLSFPAMADAARELRGGARGLEPIPGGGKAGGKAGGSKPKNSNKKPKGKTKSVSATPTKAPTATPTGVPTGAPTLAPTATPTEAPTGAPTLAPTATPTDAPTGAPTLAPTATPTGVPTGAPTLEPECPLQGGGGYTDTFDGGCYAAAKKYTRLTSFPSIISGDVTVILGPGGLEYDWYEFEVATNGALSVSFADPKIVFSIFKEVGGVRCVQTPLISLQPPGGGLALDAGEKYYFIIQPLEQDLCTDYTITLDFSPS